MFKIVDRICNLFFVAVVGFLIAMALSVPKPMTVADIPVKENVTVVGRAILTGGVNMFSKEKFDNHYGVVRHAGFTIGKQKVEFVGILNQWVRIK